MIVSPLLRRFDDLLDLGGAGRTQVLAPVREQAGIGQHGGETSFASLDLVIGHADAEDGLNLALEFVV
jgi:hypothetical protein